jgi:DNA processing protein
MTTAVAFSNTVSPYKELLAYEYLYSRYGMSRKRMGEFFEKRGTLPSEALGNFQGLFSPDEKCLEEIRALINERRSFSILVEGTPQFPSKLEDAESSLPFFYYKGNIDLISMPCVSVVGTRNPTPEGILQAELVSRSLTMSGYTIVSGLAKGIDTAAIKECLRNKGSVVGVIGTPVDRCYPANNKELQDKVAEVGLLISQVPLYRYEHQPFDTKKYYFPERNSTMAALSEATVIIEAGETSGTRTQAKACIQQGRTLIILESVFEKVSWAEKFLQQGALKAKGVQEVLEILNSEKSNYEY